MGTSTHDIDSGLLADFDHDKLFNRLLEYLRAGLELEDAAALVGILPTEIESLVLGRERDIARAEAEFRRDMTAVISDAATIKRDSRSAQFLLRRKVVDRRQLTLSFAPVQGTGPDLDMPSNGRENPGDPGSHE